jgi:Tfp pilus assembly protein PilN
MEEKELSASMRLLPRTSASPAFTSEVMRAVRNARKEERRAPAGWRLATAFALAAVLLLGVPLVITKQAENARVAVLRAEQQKLEAELEAVKQLAHEAEPMVVLENDDGTRVIMDVDSAIQPASMRHYD